MSIKHELEMCGVSVSLTTQREALAGISPLNRYLRNCKEPDEVLPLLRVELLGLGRLSMISRMYGRYRKLLPVRDFEEMSLWTKQEKKRRSQST